MIKSKVTQTTTQTVPRVVSRGNTAALRPSWKCGPTSPVISQNEVHIWRASLEAPWSWTLDEALSIEDHARADRFRFESDRRRFATARASLRLILSRYLNKKPKRIRLDAGVYGKPFLADEKSSLGLRFNMSHSNRLALIAIARDREVGVDLEFMRPDFATKDVAEHFFSKSETEVLASFPFELRTEAFFNCWTRKEAYIKARGEGLSCPLAAFDVSLAPDSPATLLNTRIDGDDASRWSLCELYPELGYAGALAVEGQISRLSLWDFC